MPGEHAVGESIGVHSDDHRMSVQRVDVCEHTIGSRGGQDDGNTIRQYGASDILQVPNIPVLRCDAECVSIDISYEQHIDH